MGDGVTTSVGCGVGSIAGRKGTEVGPEVCSAVEGRSAGCEVGALEGTGVGCTVAVIGAGDGERDGSGVNSCMIVNSTSFISTFWPYPPSSGSTVPDPLAFAIREPFKSEKKASLREVVMTRKVAGLSGVTEFLG